MPHTVYGWVSASVCLAISFYALLRGEKPERAGGSVLLAALIAVIWLQDRHAWLDPKLMMLAVDGAMLAAFCVFVATWKRVWLLFATSLQLLATAEHFVAVGHHFPKASLSLQAALTYGVMAALAWGVWRVDRARQNTVAGAPKS